ncbi:cupin domain-containing protein [Paracoccus sp. TOH]|uniref:Cupin domain-containing protein n=1 Tax=Paracoccus simplex TaxID=2086346 RepID=A0ABV7RVJ2_9RHOB|nr:cupin domain-containing protein [Paracoccus sp. TOH]WJS84351.1 cupin domain-containing protein [Paracoccus sp. TOH]
MAIKKFGTYQTPSVQPITEDLDWWHPVEGSPSMKTWIENQSEDGKFLTGYWEATPGSYRVRYDVDEYIRIFEGKVTLTDNGQEPRSFGAGDTFVIEAGFDGIWKTEETVRKAFAIRVR